MQTKGILRMMLIAVVLPLTIWLEGSGCWLGGGRQVIEEPFTESQVREIHHGKTTKKDILKWFGPPLGIARQGKDIMMPLPEKVESEDVKADIFKKIFPSSSAWIQEPQIYYYIDSEFNSTAFSLLGFPHGGNAGITLMDDRTLTVKRLWILIDEQSGKVVDHLIEVSKNGRSIQKIEEH